MALLAGLLLGVGLIAVVVVIRESGDEGPSAQAQVDAPSRDIDSYVLFAYESLVFKGRGSGDTGVISGGNVGVNNVDPDPNATELTFSGPVKMPVDGTQVVGNRARIDPGVPGYPTSIYELYANKVTASFDSSVLRHPCTSGCDPALKGAWSYDTPIIPSDELPKLPPINPGSEDVTVAAGTTRSLAPGRYGNVRIQDGATLKLSAGLYEMRSLSGGVNATLSTDPAAEVRILEGVGFNSSALIGDPTQDHSKPQSADFARFYVKCEGINPVTACVSFGHSGQIHGQLLAPTGRLNLGGGNEYFGRFWAANIAGDPNNKLTFRRPASKTGSKFEDINANGRRDQGEPGLEGWTIYVDYDDDGRLDGNEPSARTGPDGGFKIEDVILPNDASHPTWKIREIKQDGWTCSTPPGCVREETFVAGENKAGNDFGNWRPGSVSGTKFKDSNGDGSRDSGETGLAGYTMYLDLNDNRQLDPGEPSAQSGNDGTYSITGVKPGTYVLRETGGDSSLRCTYPVGCSLEISAGSNTRAEGKDFGNAASNERAKGNQDPQVLRFTFQRCAKAAIKPAFTGQVRGRSGRSSVKMTQPVGCMPRKFKVKVTGTNIEKVVVKIDGHKYRTLRPPKPSFYLRSRNFSNGAHKLRATVFFTDGARIP